MALEWFHRLIRDQRGVAAPLALMVLVVLAGLTAAFVAMAGMEPAIATAHKASNQALPLAEGGVERALWALANPNSPRSFNNGALAPGDPVVNTTVTPAPYDGSQLIALGNLGGAYTMQLLPATAPAGPNDWKVSAVGYVMREGVAVPGSPGLIDPANRTAQKTLSATLGYTGPLIMPGGLTVAGSAHAQGNVTVNGNEKSPGVSNAGASCNKKGRAAITIRDQTTLSDGTVMPNSLTCAGAACGQTVGTPTTPNGPLAGTQTVSQTAFNDYLLSPTQLATLRDYAQQHGTYIKPTSSSQMNLSVTDGLVFVDTVNGASVCANPDLACPSVGNAPDPTVMANVKITGANNTGWIIVMGSLTVDGNVTYNGFIYALNDISYRGTGAGHIEGAVMSANVVDTLTTSVDTLTTGNANIYYDCNKVQNPCSGCIPPPGYTVKNGSWREVTN